MKMATAHALNVKRYGQLLAAALPMVITTEAEYDRLRATMEELVNRDEDDLSPEEVKLLDLLVTLIDRYEETHYAIERGTPHEILHHLMEARDLVHKDVWRLFGSKGVASEVLNGKRSARSMHAPWPTSSTYPPICSLARNPLTAMSVNLAIQPF